MVVGVVAAIAITAVGVISFVRDVDRLVRTDSGDAFVTDLESGEYFVYGEDDGVDLGPLDIRITRLVDGVGIDATDVDDGPSYDIAGNRGSAALAFDVPVGGRYRVETSTGVGEIASFAIGRDVGAGPLASLTRGLVIGGLLFVVGFVLVVWGAVQRGRARLRGRAEQALEESRRAIDTTLSTVSDADGRRHVATHHGRRVSQSATDLAADAPAPVRDRVDSIAGRFETAAGDLGASTEAPGELVGRLQGTLGHAQERLAAGDSLRAVARDGAGELRALGADARREAEASIAAGGEAAATARDELAARSDALVAARDDLVTQARDEADRNLAAATRVADRSSVEIGAALDAAAGEISEEAMRSAGRLNEQARAAIDAASAQLRAGASVSGRPAAAPPPPPPPSAEPPPPPPAGSQAATALLPPPPPPASTAVPLSTTRSDGPDQLAPGVADRGSGAVRPRGVEMAPPPLARRPPPTTRATGVEPPSLPRAEDVPDSPDTAGGDRTSDTRFAALAPPPQALDRFSSLASSMSAGAGIAPGEADDATQRPEVRRAPAGPPTLAPPPTGRRP